MSYKVNGYEKVHEDDEDDDDKYAAPNTIKKRELLNFLQLNSMENIGHHYDDEKPSIVKMAQELGME